MAAVLMAAEVENRPVHNMKHPGKVNKTVEGTQISTDNRFKEKNA